MCKKVKYNEYGGSNECKCMVHTNMNIFFATYEYTFDWIWVYAWMQEHVVYCLVLLYMCSVHSA